MLSVKENHLYVCTALKFVDVLAGAVRRDGSIAGSGDELPEDGVAHIARRIEAVDAGLHPLVGLHVLVGGEDRCVQDVGLGDHADEDEDGIHLLWASDRLDVAREVDYQLTSIYSQLVILEKVMQDRETILDFLKHKIFDVVSRASRGAIAEYALTRWEDASMAAMKKQAGVEDKKENTPSTQKSDKNV